MHNDQPPARRPPIILAPTQPADREGLIRTLAEVAYAILLRRAEAERAAAGRDTQPPAEGGA